MSKKLYMGVALGLLASMLLASVPAAAQAAETELLPPPQFYTNRERLSTRPVQVTVWGELLLDSEAVGKIHCENVIATSVWNEGERGHGAFEGWGTNACKAPELEEALTKTYGKLCELGRIKCPITVFATAELPFESQRRQAEVCSEESKTKIEQCPSASEREKVSIYWNLRRRTPSFPWNVELVKVIREEEEVPLEKIGVPTEAGKSCYPTEKVVVEENGTKKEVEEPAKWQNVPAGCLKIDVIAPQVPDEIVFYGTLSPELFDGFSSGLNPSHLEFSKLAGLLVSSEGQAPETYSEGRMTVLGTEAQQLVTAK